MNKVLKHFLLAGWVSTVRQTIDAMLMLLEGEHVAVVKVSVTQS